MAHNFSTTELEDVFLSDLDISNNFFVDSEPLRPEVKTQILRTKDPERVSKLELDLLNRRNVELEHTIKV